MSRPTKTLAALSATAAAALLLTGCTQQAPEPLPTQAASATPTPTPTVTIGPYEAETPKDEATAIKDAAAAYQQFLDIRAELNANPGDTKPLEDIAQASALADVEKENGDFAKAGAHTTGTVTFELDTDMSYTAPVLDGNGKTTAEHGTATLKGCHDRSNLTLENKDGTTVKGSENNPRFKVEVIAVYNVQQGRWYIDAERYHAEETC